MVPLTYSRPDTFSFVRPVLKRSSACQSLKRGCNAACVANERVYMDTAPGRRPRHTIW